MSKGGGAGKVYFVLYLAVVLELLIIIVERDEAEQGLLKKQKETMRIVESILSQLQSGAGTEGINTRPQDEITILDKSSQDALGKGIQIKSSRTYIVEVGITDVSSELKRKEGETQKEIFERIEKYIRLGNVEEIEYQVFFNSSTDPNNAPEFPLDDDLKKEDVNFTKFNPGQTIQAKDGSSWEFLSLRKLILDSKTVSDRIENYNNVAMSSLEPLYPKDREIQIGPTYAPPGKEDSVFYYSYQHTIKDANKSATDLKKRAFVVNFQPPNRPGWYKLRFASRTNRILGVRADANIKALEEETKINIGTFQLTVRDLLKVKKGLTMMLEKYGPPQFEMLANPANLHKFDEQLKVATDKVGNEPDAASVITKLKLYGYIAKLLAPGLSASFPQNTGAIEFNIRVITPKPQTADPVASLPDVSYSFDQLPAVFEFSISPWRGDGQNIIDGRVIDNNGSNVSGLDMKPVDALAGSGSSQAILGKDKWFRGTVKTALSPGEYTVQVDHKLSGKQDTKTMKLVIFKTGLTPESEKTLRNGLGYLAFFGKKMAVTNAVPTSGLKIKPEQFRTYIYTDQEQQKPPFNGYTIANENGVFLSCQAKNVTLKITWIQPFTNQEIPLFPETKLDIRQEKPRINTMDKQDNVTQSGNRVRVTARGIRIGKPSDGKDQTSTADVEVKAGKATLETRLQGLVDIASEPTIEKDGDLYNVSFDLSVNLPRGTDMINGMVKVPIRAQATNKCAGLQSDWEEKIVSVSFKYEQEKGGRGGRQPSGGTRPAPSGGTRKTK